MKIFFTDGKWHKEEPNTTDVVITVEEVETCEGHRFIVKSTHDNDTKSFETEIAARSNAESLYYCTYSMEAVVPLVTEYEQCERALKAAEDRLLAVKQLCEATWSPNGVLSKGDEVIGLVKKISANQFHWLVYTSRADIAQGFAGSIELAKSAIENSY